MPYYNFVLYDGKEMDALGAMALRGDPDALAFAERIIQDIICGQPERYSGWFVEVTNARRSVSRIPFK